jgi:hypothetical protein
VSTVDTGEPLPGVLKYHILLVLLVMLFGGGLSYAVLVLSHH